MKSVGSGYHELEGNVSLNSIKFRAMQQWSKQGLASRAGRQAQRDHYKETESNREEDSWTEKKTDGKLAILSCWNIRWKWNRPKAMKRSKGTFQARGR